MNIVNTGDSYRIYSDALKTFNVLPAQTYTVCFHPQQGFWLEYFPNLEITEKIYGTHLKNVERVYASFEAFERNLGVMLSGAKGIGKSLFAKLLSIKAVENGYPLIIVNRYFPGISDFLGEIDQKVVVLFDEFDKTFNGGKESKDNANDPQTEMLTLFDGINVSKKLFIITCNETRNLNDYLLNRPGRFHYHFRFDFPNPEEIREYLQDKLAEKYWGEIDAVIAFSKKTDLNFDCLRAIAFELNMGFSFKEAISVLNIVNIELPRYDAYLYFTNGQKAHITNTALDLFTNEDRWIYFHYDGYYDLFEVEVNLSNNLYSYEQGGCIIEAQNFLNFELDEDLLESANEKTKADMEVFKTWKPAYILFKKRESQSRMHYAV